jgi:hypothetical protein
VTVPAAGVVIRTATAADVAALHRLAALDCAACPRGPLLVAEVEGEIRAALPLAGGASVADPFHRAAELIELLRLRAAQLGPPRPTPGRRGSGRLAEWRPAPRSVAHHPA